MQASCIVYAHTHNTIAQLTKLRSHQENHSPQTCLKHNWHKSDQNIMFVHPHIFHNTYWCALKTQNHLALATQMRVQKHHGHCNRMLVCRVVWCGLTHGWWCRLTHMAMCWHTLFTHNALYMLQAPHTAGCTVHVCVCGYAGHHTYMRMNKVIAFLQQVCGLGVVWDTMRVFLYKNCIKALCDPDVWYIRRRAASLAMQCRIGHYTYMTGRKVAVAGVKWHKSVKIVVVCAKLIITHMETYMLHVWHIPRRAMSRPIELWINIMIYKYNRKLVWSGVHGGEKVENKKFENLWFLYIGSLHTVQ